MNTVSNGQIGAVCRALRAMHDLNQPDFAERVGTTAQMIRAIERSEVPFHRASEFVLPICNASGVTIDEFDSLAELSTTAAARLARVHVKP